MRRFTMLDRGFQGILLLTMGFVACGGVEEVIPEGPPPDGVVRLTPDQVAAAGIVSEEVSGSEVIAPIQVPGVLAPPDTSVAVLGAMVEGQVVQVLVVTGEEVRAGAPLMRIRSHELVSAVRERDGARARLAFGRSALERSETLLAAGAVSREEVERRRAEHEDLSAEAVRSESRVEALHPSEDGFSMVVAPRAGTIFRVTVGPGASVVPGTPLVEMGSTETLWATGFVPEQSAGRLTPGTTISVTIPALGDASIPARLVSVGGMVDPTRRAVEVRGELSSLPMGVRPGMFATLSVAGGPAQERVILPSAAVQRTADGDVVFLERTPGEYLPRVVDVIALDGERVAVTGIPDGSRVVTRGSYILRSVAEGIEVDG